MIQPLAVRVSRGLLVAFVGCAAVSAHAQDQTVSGNLTVTGDADIGGNTFSFGTRSDASGEPGLNLLFEEGTPATLHFNATSSGAQWLWRQNNGSPQMKLTSGNQLLLFGAANPTTPAVTLDPAGTSTFSSAVQFQGTVSMSGSSVTDLNAGNITTGILPVARGGTGTSTPSLFAGSGLSITGAWPNQTVAINQAYAEFSESGLNLKNNPTLSFDGQPVLELSYGGLALQGLSGESVSFQSGDVSINGGTGGAGNVYINGASSGSTVVISAGGPGIILNGATTVSGGTLNVESGYVTLANTVTLRGDTNGNLGIGADSPGARLDVRGGATANDAKAFRVVDPGFPATAGNSSQYALGQVQISPVANQPGVVSLGRRGTTASVDGTVLGTVLFNGSGTDGVTFRKGAEIRSIARAASWGNATWPTDLAFSVNSGTQTTILSEAMRITSASNVGIGTAAPTAKLDVAGSAKVSGTLTVGGSSVLTQTTLASPNTWTAAQNFQSGLNVTAGALSVTSGALRSGSGQNLYLQPDAGATTAMTLSTNGKVGIGTTSPAYPLDVAGPNDVARFSALNGWAGLLLTKSNGQTWGFVSGNNGNTDDFVIEDRNAGRSGPKSPFVIRHADGNVGIGTAAPRAALQVQRSARAALGPVISLMNPAGNANASAALDYYTYDQGPAAPGTRLQAVDDGQYSTHFVVSTKQPGANANPLAERMRLTSSGRLLVGTSTDDGQSRLQVAGDIVVKNVGATKSVIRISPAGDIGMGSFTSGTNPNPGL